MAEDYAVYQVSDGTAQNQSQGYPVKPAVSFFFKVKANQDYGKKRSQYEKRHLVS